MTKAFDKAEPLYLEAINILEETVGRDDIRYDTITIKCKRERASLLYDTKVAFHVLYLNCC